MDFSSINTIRSVPNVKIDEEQSKATISLPSEDDTKHGQLIAYVFSENFLLLSIDIVSHRIPVFLEGEPPNNKTLKINYCSQGRCELELYNGEYTYLAGGEISLDTGQTKSTFYYPAANYKGIEIVIQLSDSWENEFCLFNRHINAPLHLLQKCAESTLPLINFANEDVIRTIKEMNAYISINAEASLLACKSIELLIVLCDQNFLDSQSKRTYYTTTQVNIAKAVHDLIMEDLSVRHTAKDLARKFTVSETSLKNYFRSVYGNGYKEYQRNARMEASAHLLESSDLKIIEIAANVGYTNQAKFGSVFKMYYGVTPMEYRRLKNFPIVVEISDS